MLCLSLEGLVTGLVITYVSIALISHAHVKWSQSIYKHKIHQPYYQNFEV